MILSAPQHFLRVACTGLFAAVLATALAAAEPAPGPPSEKPPLTRIVPPQARPLPADSAELLIQRRGFRPEDVGYVLVGPQKDVVAAHNPHTAFIPASVQKLATSVAALEILGGDHRFATKVMASPEVGGGRSGGTIWLVGGGDPLLGADGLMALCQKLRRAGVHSVAGFRYDASLYDIRPQIRLSQPEDAQYNPPVSALSLDFNRARIEWRPGRDANTIEAWSLPDVPAVALGAARPTEVPAGQNWTRGEDAWKLGTNAPRRGSAWLPLLQPAKVTAQLFRRLCARTGVRLPPPKPGQVPANVDPLAVYDSPPLTHVVQQMLKYSNNLVAELVGLAAGRRLTGQPLDLEESSRLLSDWLATSVSGTDWSSFRVSNHSGLSADAQATPAQLAALLRYADGRGYGNQGRSLLSLLPASGWQDGLGGRLRRPETAFDVWAKTGTMHFASGMAGYLLSQNGQIRSFAVFVNDRRQRRAYDADPQRRDGRWRERIYSWRSRAKALEADLLQLWVREH